MSAADRTAAMTPDELIAVITRGLDADEQAARAAGRGWYGYDAEQAIAFVDVADTRHIARHDPSRVLADVAAKRGILAEYKSVAEDYDESSATERAYVTSMTFTLHMLARPYLDQETP